MDDFIREVFLFLEERIDVGNAEHVKLYTDSLAEVDLTKKLVSCVRLFQVILNYGNIEEGTKQFHKMITEYIVYIVSLIEASVYNEESLIDFFIRSKPAINAFKVIPKDFLLDLVRNLNGFIKRNPYNVVKAEIESGVTFNQAKGHVSNLRFIKSAVETARDINELKKTTIGICSAFEFTLLLLNSHEDSDKPTTLQVSTPAFFDKYGAEESIESEKRAENLIQQLYERDSIIIDLRKELTNSCNIIESLRDNTNTISKLKNTVDNENRSLIENSKKLQEIINQNTQKIVEMEDKLLTKDKQINSMETILKNQMDFKNEEEYKQIQESYTQLQEKFSDIQCVLEKKDQYIKTIISKVSDLQSQNSESIFIFNENHRLRNTIYEINNQKTELIRTIEIQKAERNDLNNKYSHLTNLLKTSNDHRSTLSKKYKELKTQYRQFESTFKFHQNQEMQNKSLLRISDFKFEAHKHDTFNNSLRIQFLNSFSRFDSISYPKSLKSATKRFDDELHKISELLKQ